MHNYRSQDAAESEQWDRSRWETAQRRSGFGQNGLHGPSLQAALPAEIMSSVLDYLSPVDLIRVARSSKLLREIAYDDTRWVQWLKRMGCWNELEARKHVEETFGTIANVESVRQKEAAEQSQRSSLVSAGTENKPQISLKSLSDGFDQITLSTPAATGSANELEDDPILGALQQVKSVRGEARHEYGKVHAALAPFYNDIAIAGASPDNLLFKKYTDPQHQAQILFQLQAFAKCDLTEGWCERLSHLQEAISMFETAAIKEFRHGYETEDIENRMRQYAHVLYTLNGGAAAVELFIHHNHLVTRRSDFGRPGDCIDTSSQRVKLDQTQAFFTRLSVAYNEEVAIINRAFPPSVKVALPFIAKVGQDVLYPFLTAIFDELHRINIESYLTAVSSTFAQCMNLADTLLPIQSSAVNFEEFLEHVIAKVYEPHMDLYLAEELDYFRKRSEAAVDEWDRQLSEQAASTESFLIHHAPVNLLPSFSGTKASDSKSDEESAAGDASALKAQNRFSTISMPATPVTEAPTTELAAKAAIMKSKMEGIRSLFSIEVALGLVHAAKSGLERAAQFVRIGGDTGALTKQQCEAIFVTLVRILGDRHLIAGFDKAVDHLSNYRPREQGDRDQSGVEPLVTFLELVNVGDLILQMVDVFYEQELIGKKLTDRNDFVDPAVKEKKKFEQNLDERVAAGLNKGIDVLMEEVDYILATRQLATDFNPSVSTDPYRQTMDVSVSEAAVAVVDVVSSHTQMLVGSTDKSTLDVFNQEVGLRLFTALCKHLKRQRISVEGSLRLISDMNHYFNFIQRFRNNELLVYFKAFRELSQIYLIDPSDAKELATIIADSDRFQGIWTVEDVCEFAERRADWYQVKRDVERAMYGIGCNIM
ncbi:putative secretion pathway protein Sls2/Rcy1 [Aspergillus nomiae NRRL 13137]|uniref:Putative secretion pathway protein Sls2/Rcy1 n=1 Tax=Aspergillus nomiae NRRL (strain ATCC 15546 / NRRL 13137 / CBS 260.88 / M93) TaxID=1509407 RepID=A0A0L1J5M4_ASPN3|nr:putative secretion pathway protein Sls2/Rcy1 [Aspergillus nomiae NRRL 13137]KNG87039.1 putative secretion pathway protein Sls2/Rcy1 [Aspergillus nomiae NRRL 13137]